MRWEKTRRQRHRFAERADQVYQQEIVVKRPQLWSLEERNLYKLVTEVQVAGRLWTATRRRSEFARQYLMRRRDCS